MNKRKMIFGFLILLIAWIVLIPLINWIATLPNTMDYYWIILFLPLLLFASVTYPLVLIWKHYQKEIKNEDWITHIKKDKIPLILALIISLILTFLLLSTYEYSSGEVSHNGIGWHMIEGLSDPDRQPMLVSVFSASAFFFVFEFFVSYLVMSIVIMWKRSNRVKINWKTLLLAMILPLLLTGYLSYGLLSIVSEREEMWDAMTEGQTGGQIPPEVKERYDGQTQGTLIGGIATTTFYFCLLTLVFYIVINWVKKRKK